MRYNKTVDYGLVLLLPFLLDSLRGLLPFPLQSTTVSTIRTRHAGVDIIVFEMCFSHRPRPCGKRIVALILTLPCIKKIPYRVAAAARLPTTRRRGRHRHHKTETKECHTKRVVRGTPLSHGGHPSYLHWMKKRRTTWHTRLKRKGAKRRMVKKQKGKRKTAWNRGYRFVRLLPYPLPFPRRGQAGRRRRSIPRGCWNNSFNSAWVGPLDVVPPLPIPRGAIAKVQLFLEGFQGVFFLPHQSGWMWLGWNKKV